MEMLGVKKINICLFLIHAHDYLCSLGGPNWQNQLEAAQLCWKAAIVAHAEGLSLFAWDE